MTTIYDESSRLETSERLELFKIDLTVLGDTVYFIVKSSDDPDPIVWQGDTYTPFNFQSEGFDIIGRDSLPTPKITISAADSLFTGLVNQFNDLVGATVTRTVTFKKFLDGEPGANPAAHFPLDVYRVERKSSENKFQIEFELSTVFDQQGTMLPKRTINSTFCPWIYRRFNGGTSGNPLLDFNYQEGDSACPYQGSDYFDMDGNTTTAANDKASKKVDTCCKKRFGDDGILPFGGFPGASRPLF